MVKRQFRPHPYWVDPSDRRNVEYDAGGEEGRQRYLAAVAAVDAWGHPDG
jgi:hypothetical protein